MRRWRDLIRTNGDAWLRIPPSDDTDADSLRRPARHAAPADLVHGGRDPRTSQASSTRSGGGPPRDRRDPAGRRPQPAQRARDTDKSRARRDGSVGGRPDISGRAMSAIESTRLPRLRDAGGRPYRALDEISFAVSAGSFVRFSGRAGVGNRRC